jgi:hypothetical protein
MRLWFSLIICGLTLSPIAAEAAGPTAMKCLFERGAFSTVNPKNGFASEPTNNKMELTFAALNPTQGTAQLVGNVGASNVSLIDGAAGISFVEVTPTGNITLTTVYTTEVNGRFVAVHSRHMGAADRPMVSQIFGSCQPLQ